MASQLLLRGTIVVFLAKTCVIQVDLNLTYSALVIKKPGCGKGYLLHMDGFACRYKI